MTGNIFSSWLLDFDKSMRGKKVALVLDGASSHFNIQLENVNLFFLNPNTTTHCQPLDQGIIQQMKQRYRKKLLFHQVSCFDKKIEFKISLKKAVEWLVLSWRSIEKDSISKCFAKAKVIDAQIPEQSFESKIDDEVCTLQWNSQQIEEWSNFDQCCATEDQSVDIQRFTNVLFDLGEIQSNNKEDNEVDSDDEPEIPFIEGVEIFNKAINFMEQHFSELNVSEEFIHQIRLQKSSISYNIHLKKLKSLKQTKLDSFFK